MHRHFEGLSLYPEKEQNSGRSITLGIEEGTSSEPICPHDTHPYVKREIAGPSKMVQEDEDCSEREKTLKPLTEFTPLRENNTLYATRGGLYTRLRKRTTETSNEPLPVSPAGGGNGGNSEGPPIYLQLWFMVVMAAVALFLLAVFLGVGLHKALRRPPFTRERPPLMPLPLQPRSPKVMYPPSKSYMFDTVPDTTSSPNSVTLKGFTMHVEEVTNTKILEDSSLSAGEVGIVTVSTGHMSAHGPSQSPLRRSVSQLIDRKEGDGEDGVWDPYFRAHDSGMFDEEFVDTIKGFSTVRKEHTMFTDTNL
ncbi:usherin isoform X2 [Brachyhypopomus gauderio]|uniref:usherin isoform X2 n=1 Tax=Brachyhypopomus gauderio TaxID=698409 RepID=UPI004041B37B